MPRTPKKPKPAYRVHGRTSTRASVDADDPRFNEWVNFEDGEVYADWPAHAPVEDWVASGHWELIQAEETE